MSPDNLDNDSVPTMEGVHTGSSHPAVTRPAPGGSDPVTGNGFLLVGPDSPSIFPEDNAPIDAGPGRVPESSGTGTAIAILSPDTPAAAPTSCAGRQSAGSAVVSFACPFGLGNLLDGFRRVMLSPADADGGLGAVSRSAGDPAKAGDAREVSPIEGFDPAFCLIFSGDTLRIRCTKGGVSLETEVFIDGPADMPPFAVEPSSGALLRLLHRQMPWDTDELDCQKQKITQKTAILAFDVLRSTLTLSVDRARYELEAIPCPVVLPLRQDADWNKQHPSCVARTLGRALKRTLAIPGGRRSVSEPGGDHSIGSVTVENGAMRAGTPHGVSRVSGAALNPFAFSVTRPDAKTLSTVLRRLDDFILIETGDRFLFDDGRTAICVKSTPPFPEIDTLISRLGPLDHGWTVQTIHLMKVGLFLTCVETDDTDARPIAGTFSIDHNEDGELVVRAVGHTGGRLETRVDARAFGPGPISPGPAVLRAKSVLAITPLKYEGTVSLHFAHGGAAFRMSDEDIAELHLLFPEKSLPVLDINEGFRR